jgi:hypothetical protein
MVARFLGDAGEFEEAETILNKATHEQHISNTLASH